MGKRKNDEVKEIVEIDKETTVFVNCRKFLGMKEKELKGYIESLGFPVKLVRKTLKHRHGLVDVGSIETAKDLIKKMNHSSYKGDAVIADFMKKDSKTDAKPKRANTKTLSILDRLLCIRGISKFVSKKTLTGLFKEVESVIIPSQKKTELRDVLVVFQKPSHVVKAIKEFQGYELAGEKLMLETLLSVPAEVKEGDLVEEEEEVEVDSETKGNKKKLIENDKSKKSMTKKVEEEEDEDDDDDDDEEMMEFEDDEDEEEDDEEEEVPEPPKKIQKKKK